MNIVEKYIESTPKYNDTKDLRKEIVDTIETTMPGKSKSMVQFVLNNDPFKTKEGYVRILSFINKDKDFESVSNKILKWYTQAKSYEELRKKGRNIISEEKTRYRLYNSRNEGKDSLLQVFKESERVISRLPRDLEDWKRSSKTPEELLIYSMFTEIKDPKELDKVLKREFKRLEKYKDEDKSRIISDYLRSNNSEVYKELVDGVRIENMKGKEYHKRKVRDIDFF